MAFTSTLFDVSFVRKTSSRTTATTHLTQLLVVNTNACTQTTNESNNAKHDL